MESIYEKTDISLAIADLKSSIQDLQAVYLYGSVIGEEFRPDSDLDIAIKIESDLNNLIRWKIQEALAVKLKRNVDLLVLRNSSLVMQFEVISTGVRVYCSDEAMIDLYETLIFSRYLDFNFTRKSIIKAILKQGSIYGD